MRTAIIDSNYLGSKAKFTCMDLSYNGMKTGIIYNFLSQIITITKAVRPDQMIFCWDSRRSASQRIKRYPFYKASRYNNLDPDEMAEWKKAKIQFQILRREVLPRIGFKNQFWQQGYEADDLIAQYVIENRDDDNVVVTADEDMYQLLDHCKIYKPTQKEYYDKSDLHNEYGIAPFNWITVKALAGCKSDDVPGIDGVGEKTAAKFIRGELKPTTKAAQKIATFLMTDAFNIQNKWLVTLPLEGTKSFNMEPDVYDDIEFTYLCEQYGFKSLPPRSGVFSMLFG